MKSCIGMTAATMVMLCAACSTGVNGENVVGRAGSPAWFSSASPETQRAHFQGICSGYGYSPSTPEMTTCIAEEARAARGHAEARRLAASQQMQESAKAMQHRPVTCNTYGNTTTCY